MSGKISKFSNPVVIKDVDCKGVDVVALVKHTIDKKCASFVIRKDEDEHFIISAVFKAELRNKEVDLSDRKSTHLNSSHVRTSRMPSSA